MSKDVFESGKENSSSPLDMMGFALDALDGAQVNMANASEKVEELLEHYGKLNKAQPNAYPYSMTVMHPEWIGDKELVILSHQHNGKTAIMPILFGGDVVEEVIGNSKETMTRSPAYNVTYMRPATKDSKEDALREQSRSRFLTLAFTDLKEAGLISPQTSYDAEHLVLAGCVVVPLDRKIEPGAIIACAVSEMRSAMWRLHGTSNFTAQERDLNYLNHRNVTTTLDLTTDPQAKDVLGNPLFSPLCIRLSHYMSNGLSVNQGKQLTPKIDVHGYLDFRPLDSDEYQKYISRQQPVPFLIPQFVITGVVNRKANGVVTPTLLLDALAGIANFRGKNFTKLMDQASLYSTTFDTECTTYDFNQLGALLAIEFNKRQTQNINFQGQGMHRIQVQPMDPVMALYGEANFRQEQKERAYSVAFGDLEILMDIPQSGETAQVRRNLLTDLAFNHHKFTGQQLQLGKDYVGIGMLVPQGTYSRASGASVQTRDKREVMNTLGLMSKFNTGADDLTDNYMDAVNHMAGETVIDSDDNDRHFKANYTFTADTLIEDGSFRLENEAVRSVFSAEYLDTLLKDLDANKVSYQIHNSGKEAASRIRSIRATSSSVNMDNLY